MPGSRRPAIEISVGGASCPSPKKVKRSRAGCTLAGSTAIIAAVCGAILGVVGVIRLFRPERKK